MDPLPERFDGWTLGEMIAISGYAGVFSATNPAVPGNWVIKIVQKTRAVESANGAVRQLVTKEMFGMNRELLVYESLRRNPGVSVAIFPKLPAFEHFTGETETFRYIVIERIVGTDLEDWFESERVERRPERAEVYEIGIQLLSAIRYLHELGWIYRDIKPMNAMYETATKRVVVIDFGTAEAIADPKGLMFAGNHMFGSYSTLAGDVKPADPYDDVESVGYLMYYLLNEGRLPWGEVESERELIESKETWNWEEDEDLTEFPELRRYFAYVRRMNPIRPDKGYRPNRTASDRKKPVDYEHLVELLRGGHAKAIETARERVRVRRVVMTYLE